MATVAARSRSGTSRSSAPTRSPGCSHGWAARPRRLGATFEPHRINGQPGVIFRGPHGGVFSVMSIEVVDGHVATIRSVVNPDKLGHLGLVESLRDVMEDAAGREQA